MGGSTREQVKTVSEWPTNKCNYLNFTLAADKHHYSSWRSFAAPCASSPPELKVGRYGGSRRRGFSGQHDEGTHTHAGSDRGNDQPKRYLSWRYSRRAMITVQVISRNQKLWLTHRWGEDTRLVSTWCTGHADKLVHELHEHEPDACMEMFALRLCIITF